jgi:hypothetical protein
VDVHDQSGAVMTEKVGQGVIRADTGEDTEPKADAVIARILKENGGAVR